MTFAAPNASLLLILFPLLIAGFFIWSAQRTRRDLQRFAAGHLLPRLVEPDRQKQRVRQWFLRGSCLFFLLFALCGPQWGYQWQNVRQNNLEIVFALDTSKSMLAVDLKPNRLERAKLAVRDFLQQNPGNKVGLIAFSGSSFAQCPLTIDYNAFNTILDALNVFSIPKGGTAIGEAIQTAIQTFKAGAGGNKVLVLITDGENHEGDPVAAAQKAAQMGIKVFTVGIGNPQGELILAEDEKGNQFYLKDDQGNVVKSALNETMLKKIAAAGNGAYLRGSGPALGLDTLYRSRLSGLNRGHSISRLQKRQLNRYQIPLLIAFVLLVLEFRLTDWRRKPKVGKPAVSESQIKFQP